MSAVKIRWTQRAAGRWDGFEETVELTSFVQGCIDQGRAEILAHIEPEVVHEHAKWEDVKAARLTEVEDEKPLLLNPTPNEPKRRPASRRSYGHGEDG